MKPDTLLINNTEYRVEINMNSVQAWERLSGKKLGEFEIEAAQSVKTGGVATRAMLLWLFVAIKEGEEIEGRKFNIDFLSFTRMLKPSVMTQFASIFIKQYIGDSYTEKVNQENAEAEKKKTATLSRLRSFAKSRWVKWVGVLLILAFAGLFIFGRRFGV